MTDREKAIKGLEWILADDRFGFGINWETGEPRDDYEKAGKIITDTIALLKEQEPVEPNVIIDTLVCGNCGTRLERQSMVGDNILVAERFEYCPICGRKVKWE